MRALGEELQRRWGQPARRREPARRQHHHRRPRLRRSPQGRLHDLHPARRGVELQPVHLPEAALTMPRRTLCRSQNCFFSISALVGECQSDVKTLDELAALARARPKTLAYMAPSVPLALFMEKFNAQQATDLVRVPFRGGAETAKCHSVGRCAGCLPGHCEFPVAAASRHHDGARRRQHPPLAGAARRADAAGAELSRQSHARVLRLGGADRHAGPNHPQAARRDREHRRDAGVPATGT